MTGETYQRGDRIVLIWTTDEHTQLEPGTRGSVTFIDDLGTVHTRWDDGSRLGMAARHGDEFRHLTDAELAEEQAASRRRGRRTTLTNRSGGEPSDPAQRLLALAEELNVEPLRLDDLVHDLVSHSASEINNGGPNTQIPYLLDQLGETETEQALRNAANPQHVDRQ